MQVVGKPGEDFTSGELIELARERQLLDVIVPYAKDQAKALGRKLKAWRGRERTDKRGRRYEFGKHKGGKGLAVYTTTIFSAPAWN